MQTETHLVDVARVIQLSVAPVFLLTGVSGLLAVLTNRLARIIDRARLLEDRLTTVAPVGAEPIHAELATLSNRARFVNRAITLSTICALLICLLIVTGFAGAFLAIDLARVVGSLFVTALLALIGALITFLREVSLATASLRIGSRT